MRPDSKLLNLIEVGHEVSVKLVLQGIIADHAAIYEPRVEHISEIVEGPYQGHFVVGMSFLPPLD